MNQAETAKLSELLEQWNDADEFSRCIEAIEAIPEQERGYFLTVKLSRAYSNLAVLGDHRAHGTDGAVDGALIRERPLLERQDGLFLSDGIPLRRHRL